MAKLDFSRIELFNAKMAGINSGHLCQNQECSAKQFFSCKPGLNGSALMPGSKAQYET